MELLENLHWPLLRSVTNLNSNVVGIRNFNDDSMKITQTKVDTQVPSGSEGVDYEIRHIQYTVCGKFFLRPNISLPPISEKKKFLRFSTSTFPTKNDFS